MNVFYYQANITAKLKKFGWAQIFQGIFSLESGKSFRLDPLDRDKKPALHGE